ncbi:unnamed protein product [Acanthoscelides obtectus]|uniref:PDZ domain-containing protein n=1 Tax=Acanthoscelides obtectus TaxID=200917 RepID=A0A9P0JXM1_ACAOB|nr:unnamed protein product [Acanthoscelides obtectus]CAK1639091.1 Patj homolog [Acanthoscelides obtectus]
MVLSTEWSQVEVIDLLNDGSGLGFGLVGGRSTGVVIKSILPGGIADKDGRLQSGDHILQIGEINLRGLTADQVATVLRQAGPQVRMVVARPIELNSLDFDPYNCAAPIVPTKILTDPEELDRQLLQNGYTTVFYRYSEPVEAVNNDSLQNNFTSTNCQDLNQISGISRKESLTVLKRSETQSPIIKRSESQTTSLKHSSSQNITPLNNNCLGSKSASLGSQTSCKEQKCNGGELNGVKRNSSVNFCDDVIITPDTLSPIDNGQVIITPVDIEHHSPEGPETERFSLTLTKDEHGLGITVAGYVCEREDLCGIFVKSLNENSEAYKCGKIKLNDRIIEVDGCSLLECSNYEAVKKLKDTGQTVTITFERYLSGPKFEHLQEAFAGKERTPTDISPASPSATTLSWIPIENIEKKEEPERTSLQSVSSEVLEDIPENKEVFIEDNFEANLEEDLESAIKHKWESIIGCDAEIVVANLTKLKGLGISLEGTVDVEDGVELRPHHYIRSILPEGPVGKNGKLGPGDELLEVNGQRLLGIKHVEVVKILRELPATVRLVCSREHKNRVINTSQDREAFEARNILGGSLKNLLPQPEQRLIKALSDTSLNTSSSPSGADESNLDKVKSRSLEVTNVAMWSEEIEYVDLVKGDKGLGFSILDYQDPLDPKSSVIVVRSLVPNGAAEQNGKITPGDRLISVNSKVIKNVTLDEAVQALKGTMPGIVRLGISKPLQRQSESRSDK